MVLRICVARCVSVVHGPGLGQLGLERRGRRLGAQSQSARAKGGQQGRERRSQYGLLVELQHGLGAMRALGPGRHRLMAVKFEHFQVVHFYQHRLILTLIGTQQARLGAIRQLAQDLAPLIQDIAHTVLKD
ncbi:uncharacterized protein LOC131888615 [Tigriopus californicus]|uniref:uncharacterized protein LOC131888615 n=1 Tax=Tigriopus californicus TaxID=6832 RepID=UPI0027DA59B8|nr:uncharacterized protein LOC131888615 [Tigriopus californicus]